MTEGRPDVRQLTLSEVKERIAWNKAMREGKDPDGEPSRVGHLPPQAVATPPFRTPTLSYLERKLLNF